MDTIILGLLILKSRTIYELRERINKGLNMMYSSSMGSIQAAVKKLLEYEYIVYNEKVDNGKYKKIYSITAAGNEYFIQWVNTPMQASQSKDPELVKLYFMGLSDKTTRIERIENYIKSLAEVYQTIKYIYEESKSFQAEEKDIDIVNYQLLSAKYGVDTIKFLIDWYSQLLKDIKEGRI
jgi:DNA-binding PadR family transcriptional regulator